ncbi:MAG: transcriptional regulator [Gammaproteobacteria bacterium]|jgi:DNA-binding phage protein|nr:transcriptional regulator [Gammaproteobacteria bacterium]
MALTKAFRDTVMARAQRDRTFREAMLSEAITHFLEGDLDAGKAMLRDYINATVGFEALAERTGIPAKSLHRMLGQRGNPSIGHFVEVLKVLQASEGISIGVSTERNAA